MFNTFHHSDCFDLMPQIPDQSIDLVLTDLPYETLHKGNPKASWDRQLPLDRLWPELLRIAKPSAPFVMFGAGMFTAQLIMSQPTIYKYNLVWAKNRATGFLNANRMPMPSHEDIVVFYRQQPTYHPQMTRADKPSHPIGQGKHRINDTCDGKYNHPTDKTPVLKRGSTYDYAHVRRAAPTQTDPTLRYPRSVLQFPKEQGRGWQHPTQKPIALLRWLIRTYTNPGDVVFDPCVGSGNTLIAAIQEHRQYIGSELNAEYFTHAQQRIAEELSHLPFPLPDE